MDMRLQLTPAQERGLMRAAVSLQDPEVSMPPLDGGMPTVCIEEGGVGVDLEFPDIDSVRRFQQRVAELRPREPLTAMESG